MRERETEHQVAAGGMADEVDLVRGHLTDELVHVLDAVLAGHQFLVRGHARHTLPHAVQCQHAEALGEAGDVPRPVVGGGRHAHAHAAVDEDHNVALPIVEIARGDAVDVDELRRQAVHLSVRPSAGRALRLGLQRPARREQGQRGDERQRHRCACGMGRRKSGCHTLSSHVECCALASGLSELPMTGTRFDDSSAGAGLFSDSTRAQGPR